MCNQTNQKIDLWMIVISSDHQSALAREMILELLSAAVLIIHIEIPPEENT